MKRFFPFLLSVCILFSAGAPVLAADDDYAAIPATADSYIINSILSGLGLQLFSSGMSVSEIDSAIGDLWELFRSDVSAGAWEPDPSWNSKGVNFFSVYSELKSAIHTPSFVGLSPITGDPALVSALYITVHPVIYNSVLAFRDWYKWKYLQDSDVVSVIGSSASSGYIFTGNTGSFIFPTLDQIIGSSDTSFSIYGQLGNIENKGVYSFTSGLTLIEFESTYIWSASNALRIYSGPSLVASITYSSSEIALAYVPNLGFVILEFRDGAWSFTDGIVRYPVYAGSAGSLSRQYIAYNGFAYLTEYIPFAFSLQSSPSSSASLDIWDDSDPVGTPIDEPADVPVIIGLGDLVGSLGDLLSGTKDFVVHSIEVGADAATNIRDALQNYIDKVGEATEDLAVSVPGASSISLQGTIVKAEDIPAEIPTDTPSGFTPIIPIPDLNLSNLGTAFRSIWHYIEEWLATFRNGISWMFNLYSYLPYAIVVPLYAGIAFMLIFYILKKVGF